MSFVNIARRAAKFAADNSPTILTTIGVIGTVTTAYLAGKASFEASQIINLKENLEESTATNSKELVIERTKLVWKLYIPAAGMCAATVVCIIGANSIGSRRAAGLAAAYSIIEKTGAEYKEKVIEKIGEKKEQALRDEIVQDRIDRSYTENVELFGVVEGELCYDNFSDRYFRGSIEGINSAVNKFNNDLNHNGYGCLGDLYRLLEIDAPVYSENIGWNSDRLLEVRFSSALAHGVKPVIEMHFRHEPLPDYGRFR